MKGGATPGALLILALAGCAPGAGSSDQAGEGGEEVARTSATLGPVTATVEVRPRQPRLSDEPTLTLTIDAADGIEITPPPFGESLGGFLIRDYRRPLPEIKDGRRILRQEYSLEPVATGKQTILPIPIRFEDHRPDGDGGSHQLETEALEIEVVSMLGETAPSLDDLKPPVGPKELPAASARSWVAWLGGGALVLLVAGALLWRRRRRAVPLEKQFTPTELAHLELEQLLELDPLGRGDVKTFYVELTGIVRRYIERTTGIRAPEQTTREFLHAMRDSHAFATGKKVELRAFLESADLVKFAAFEPSSKDIESSFELAKRFVGLASAVPGVAA